MLSTSPPVKYNRGTINVLYYLANSAFEMTLPEVTLEIISIQLFLFKRVACITVHNDKHHY